MNTSLLLQISLRSLAKHKGRALLTMLGIIIGIGAIIATLAIGRGAVEKTKQKFLAMGDNYIVVYAGNWLQEGKTTAKKRKRVPNFIERDILTIKKLCPIIKSISPFLSTRNIVSYRTNSINVKLKSGDENLIKVINRKLLRGNFYTQYHAKRGARVAILGEKSAKELFSSLDPIGKVIQIKGVPFTVIGVLKKIEHYSGAQDPNFDIFMPMKTMKRHILKTGGRFVNAILISAPTRESIPIVTDRLRKTLRFKRKVKDNEKDNFTIWDQASIMKAAKAATGTLQLLLLIIASISLLVGGIGIMNIMLVSVSERTREIGIRMALGANSRMILRQFLIEALTLCFIGGIIGTALGIGIPHAIAKITQWSPIVSLDSILIAFLTTSAIGVFFGFYPAYKAAHLSPVDALAER